MNFLKRIFPTLLVLVSISLACYGGFNTPLFNYPLSLIGNVLSIDPAVTLQVQMLDVASLTNSVSSATYSTTADIPNNASFSFAQLSDTATRTGQAGKVYTVNPGENGYEWTAPAGGIPNPASTGANIFTGDQQIDGNASISMTLRLKYNQMEFGTVDPIGRTQIWNHAPSAILRLGSLEEEGDPGPQTDSQGIVVYGLNSNATFTVTDWAYARIKADRFGLLESIADVQNYLFRVDGTEMYLKTQVGSKYFTLNRSTRALVMTGDATFNQVFASSATVSLPLQLTTKDYVDSVAGGGLTRETVTTGTATNTVVFSLPLKSENDTILSVNGLILIPSIDYTFPSSYSVLTSSVMSSGSRVHVIH